MGLDEFALRVLLYHLAPSVTTVLVGYGFVLGVTRLLRLRSPSWLYWVFVIPLVKGLMALVRGVPLLVWPPSTKPFAFGL